jgi:copper(I)-binding protein
MSIRRITKKALVATLMTGALLAASVATAAWLASGTGSGAAKAITATDLTVEVATATADLYPGATNGDLFLKINNPNPYPVTVTSVDAGAGPVSSHDATCDTNGSEVTLDASTAVTIDVPAAGSTTTTVADIVNMGVDADDACQGATFDIPVDVSGENDQTP